MKLTNQKCRNNSGTAVNWPFVGRLLRWPEKIKQRRQIYAATHSLLTNCIIEIKSWLQTKFLNLNGDKLEVIIIGPKALTKSTHNFTFNTDSSISSTSPYIRPARRAHHQNSLLSPHEHCLPPSIPLQNTAAEILIHAFITSGLMQQSSLWFTVKNPP